MASEPGVKPGTVPATVREAGAVDGGAAAGPVEVAGGSGFEQETAKKRTIQTV